MLKPDEPLKKADKINITIGILGVLVSIIIAWRVENLSNEQKEVGLWGNLIPTLLDDQPQKLLVALRYARDEKAKFGHEFPKEICPFVTAAFEKLCPEELAEFATIPICTGDQLITFGGDTTPPPRCQKISVSPEEKAQPTTVQSLLINTLANAFDTASLKAAAAASPNPVSANANADSVIKQSFNVVIGSFETMEMANQQVNALRDKLASLALIPKCLMPTHEHGAFGLIISHIPFEDAKKDLAAIKRLGIDGYIHGSSSDNAGVGNPYCAIDAKR